ncbi:Tex family protein [Verrucomicrobiota bacterium]
MSFDPIPFASKDLNISARQIGAVAKLFREGNTVPFIARYRKEATGNLDEVQIANIQDKLTYYNSLEARRQTILKSIDEQGKLSETLEKKIRDCLSKTELEDLYLPYKPKRRTRAMIAKEKGLEPLAVLISGQPLDGNVEAEAEKFINAEKEVASVADALQGARDIVAEQIAETAEVRAYLRKLFSDTGILVSAKLIPDDNKPTKFEQYYDFREAVSKIPSHRYLAIRRGEAEGVLRKKVEIDNDTAVAKLKEMAGVNPASPFTSQLELTVEDAFKRLLALSVELDLSVEMKMKADRAAVEIFAQNLRNLLLAAPYGEKPVIGIDPGLRTGCKCVAIDATGKYLETITIYPSQGKAKEQKAEIDLGNFIAKHNPRAIAVGNGTAGRETEAFTKKLLRTMQKKTSVVSVSESGASVYSASEVARDEFPDLDLTVRGAISIARRLQDPLAELVKVDPKSIGVGQYQHDVYQQLLKDKLDEVVVSCVNHVGVELNTASALLLARVAGIGPALAKTIVEHRNTNGAFQSRQNLLKVAGLGPRTFEQCAGFLRIRGGAHPLDASAVHPERYAVVEKMAADLGVELSELVGDANQAGKVNLKNYITDDLGTLTLQDIVDELKKPGRDPREQFEEAGFREDVMEMTDLKIGMELNGIVTNVTAFGAFVDIGVHQDGLVHISCLSNKFIKDPSEAVSTGDRIKVWVQDVDLQRKRISLTAVKNKLEQDRKPRTRSGGPKRKPQRSSGFSNNPFADL